MSSVPKRPSPGGLDAIRALDEAYDFLVSIGRRWQLAQGAVESPDAPSPPAVEAPKPALKARTRKLSPSRLAKWEAAWQAEQDAEAES